MGRQLFISFLLFLCTGCARNHFTTEDQDSMSLFLSRPDAVHVQFASSLDRYTLHDTQKNGLGFWKISVPSATEYSYFYVVDGSASSGNSSGGGSDDAGGGEAGSAGGGNSGGNSGGGNGGSNGSGSRN